jgi:hypothetical protein
VVAIDRYQQALTQNPWLERFPLLVKVTPVYHDGQWSVQDSPGGCLPLELADLRGWQLLAMSGGKAIDLMGEWDGQVFRPLGLWRDGNFWQANYGEVWS